MELTRQCIHKANENTKEHIKNNQNMSDKFTKDIHSMKMCQTEILGT